jgi:hypothetical protein
MCFQAQVIQSAYVKFLLSSLEPPGWIPVLSYPLMLIPASPGGLDILLVDSLEADLFHDGGSGSGLVPVYLFIVFDPIPVPAKCERIQQGRREHVSVGKGQE